ncbi:DUF4429 domain-containing protein [Streptomyces sp. CAI-85]|uniref:DUF4429 domain-containing protein n=1 Tax=Streptomyces sp. CAI-85 TaxID=1472662 RepID=UPI0015875575|nr:DUF4429 domain-containing protein [Streptomyces sp. CAI-85]NUV60626.1 DUF4429 domain-containing protein [Streptomyces sp. CAI-85]
MIEVKGHTGQVAFDGEYVTIMRKGLNARLSVGKGEKRMHISQISGVQWKPAGLLVNGFIQFTVPGGNERRSAFGSQTKDAAHDENSVVFHKKQMPQFEKLRTAVEAAIAAHHKASAAPAIVSSESVADELAKLGALREQGLLSPEEFEAQKARLLAD